MAENTPLKDSELTPEQLKKREKNRKQRAARAARKAEAAKQAANGNNTDSKKPVQANFKKTREEIEAERLNRKTSKLEKNAEDAVVVVAESRESRSIAFPLDEINIITSTIRRNMGSERISFETGIDLLTKFQERVQSNVELFIDLAHSKKIGSKYGIRNYEEEEAKRSRRMLHSMQNETPDEAKEREALDKVLEKASETVEKQYEALEKAKEAVEKALENVDAATKNRIEAGRQRAKEEREALAEAKRVEKEAEKEAKRVEKEALEATKKAEKETATNPEQK